MPGKRITLLTEAEELQIFQYCLDSDSEIETSQNSEVKRALSLYHEMLKTKCNSIEQDINSVLDVVKNVLTDEQPQDINDSVSTKETDAVDELSTLVDTFKKTSNHITVLDAYRLFVTELCKNDSELKQDVVCDKKTISDLRVQNDKPLICSMQNKVLQFLHHLCDDKSETDCDVTMQEKEEKDADSSDTVHKSRPVPQLVKLSQDLSSNPRTGFLMSPKTPRCSAVPRSLLNESSSPSTPFSNTERQEVRKLFIHDVLRSYLHLLVNPRSQVALARVFNVPERGLDHLAFTQLKHEARNSGLSMYQELSSYMLRVNMGLKCYAHLSSSPLFAHAKGLGNLVAFTQKLQDTVEEDPNCGSACRRVVNIIKNNMALCKSNRFPRSAVDQVAEEVHQALATLVKEANCHVSPVRADSDGGSVLGRKCMRIVQTYLDTSALVTSPLSQQLMRDVRFSAQTPTRFPCLLSQFRSPCIMEDEEVQEEHDDEKIDDIKPKTNRINSQFVSNALFVPDCNEDLLLSPNSLNSIEVLPSKTIAQPRAGFDKPLQVTNIQEDPIRTAFDKIEGKVCEEKGKPRQGKRCAETLSEQENSNVKQEGPKKAKSKKTEPKKKSAAENILDSPKSTKSLKQQKDKKVDKSCRRRLLPQVKGQSKLTGFFRV